MITTSVKLCTIIVFDLFLSIHYGPRPTFHGFILPNAGAISMSVTLRISHTSYTILSNGADANQKQTRSFHKSM